ncbi:MAG TPA: ADP-polyphosphate phosphotransferase [Steroidobacteraceae bacterium]|nr:ADP-polyphosphate phosphotransferase [Steroidobacteraceae bacterium]
MKAAPAIDTDAFRVRGDKRVKLKKWPTNVDRLYNSKEHYERLLQKQVAELSDQQNLLYADDRHALLVIFQAMDAAGKDGVIKHVMSGVNPQGCQVFSFKHPSAEELDHDFLWRTTRSLPERGRIGIFNRSYYEEVLVARVHPEILEGQRVPDRELDKHGKQGDGFWQRRYRSINDLELHLHRNGTRVVKFFLHVSKEEQGRRFMARIDDPAKNWKFSSGDVKERQHWPQYMDAYEEALSHTSTAHAPWYVIPADDKRNTRLLVAKVVTDTLRDLKMQYPTVDATRRQELQTMRKVLTAGDRGRKASRK